jgi:response regulator of citrate/malate metabolism
MIDRCSKPGRKDWKYYGGKGIKVCDRWLASYENFIADMGKKPFKEASIDRRDGSKDYCPENCRWASALEQATNQGHIQLIMIDGERITQNEAARRLGMPRVTFQRWLKRGLTIDQIRKRWSERSH